MKCTEWPSLGPMPISNHCRPRQFCPGGLATRAMCPSTPGKRGRTNWVLLTEEGRTDAGQEEAAEAGDPGQLLLGQPWLGAQRQTQSPPGTSVLAVPWPRSVHLLQLGQRDRAGTHLRALTGAARAEMRLEMEPVNTLLPCGNC